MLVHGQEGGAAAYKRAGGHVRFVGGEPSLPLYLARDPDPGPL